MFGKLLKLATGTAILAGGAFASDYLFQKFVTPNLPDKVANWFAATGPRTRAYQYGTMALGTIVLLPYVAGFVGMSKKSPIKPEASPLKA